MTEIQKLVELCNASITGPVDRKVEHLILDSRKSRIPSNSVFFAIKGSSHNGHRHIDEMISKGVKVFVVDEEIPASNDDITVLTVNNVVSALQRLAAYHRSSFDIPVVGITGSNGKTIVKEWIYQLFHHQLNIVRSPRSYNSQVGVPLSVWNMNHEHELAVFEAGISEVGEMGKLAEIILPDIGIFTNIGDAHSIGFVNESEKIHEKLKLFENCKTLIYRKDSGKLSDSIELFAKNHPALELLSWSSENKNEANLEVLELESKKNTTHIELQWENSKFSIDIPFGDEASFENCMHCILCGLHLGMNIPEIIQSAKLLHPIEMRLNQKKGANSCQLISDFYNSDLKSLELALDWMDQLHKSNRKTVIMSDILQSALKGSRLYESVNQLLNTYKVERLIGIGSEMSSWSECFDIPIQSFFNSTEEFISKTSIYEFDRETILIKGARSFEFEKIERYLERQAHQTQLEIDLNALGQNLAFFRKKLRPSTKIMAMVKAFSYGSGGHEIARFLEFSGIDYLAVAYSDEGVSLRKDGIRRPIMVMNPDRQTIGVILDYELEPEIYSLEILDELISTLESKGVLKVKIHLELNTGMNRLGFDESNLDSLMEILMDNSQVEVASIFSHLTSSDMHDHDDETNKQFAQFDHMYERLSESLCYRPIKHILNSSGIVRFPHGQYDMVRLGIGLYGIDPSGEAASELKSIGTLKSIISQVRNVPAAEPIGYGRQERSNQERRIAIVAIGYADGLSRSLSQGKGYFKINGYRAPIVGNICMDMTMCDVTHIPCRAGDEVIVFGNDPSIVEMAEVLNTIPYEILTSVSSRVKRVFTRE